MDSSPVSFVIPAYNCADHLPEAVASIVEGNFGPEDEIIIVDDGSKDDTWQVMERLASANTQIKTVRHGRNKGSAAAGRNTAIDMARHDLFFCLDSDNLLLPGTIEKLKRRLGETGADVAAFGEVRFFNLKPTQISHIWVYQPTITLADALAGHVWPGPDGNYLLTRESWQRAGRYDESVGGAVDSWAFGISQLATGSKMVTLPEVGYLHRYGHDSAWVRGHRETNLSLRALRTLIPYLDLFDEATVAYLLSAEGRTDWFDHLEEHPLRLKNEVATANGRTIHPPRKKDPLLTRARWILSHWIAPKH